MRKLVMMVLAVLITAGGFAQMSGTYYIGNPGTGPGGTDPVYATLKAACDDVMEDIVGGDITFYITSNLTEASNFALGVNTNGYTITFKPYTGVTPTVTYTQTADNDGFSAGWLIGYNTVASGGTMIPTHNIVIDGSNTVDGTTRDLSFVSAVGTNNYPFRIRGNNDNITIKNCNISSGRWSIAYAIWINPVFSSPDNYNPDNLTIDNCFISSTFSGVGCPIHVSRSGTTTVPMEDLVIKNNDIVARHRGVFLQGLTNVTLIENNSFEIDQQSPGYLSSAIEGNVIYTSGVTKILANDFKKNSTVAVTAGHGIRTIAASGGGSFVVANNFFSNYSAPDAVGLASEIIPIRCGNNVDFYNNTIVMNNINATTGSLYRGIWIAAGSPKIYNNIVITEEDDFVNYCITGTPSESDYNNFYRAGGETNAKVGMYLGSSKATLEDWQTSGFDANSVSKAVQFVSATDLHLAGSSVYDADLIGTPIPAVTTDIDGDARNPLTPFMGADEGDLTQAPSPITLAAFGGTCVNGEVVLNWETASEAENAGFYVYRDGEVYSGLIPGAGTSSEANAYTFTDKYVIPGNTYTYYLADLSTANVLKSHANMAVTVTVAEGSVDMDFSVGAAYPNPFNPSTLIPLNLAKDAMVRGTLYDIQGRRIRDLHNGTLTAGSHDIRVDGTNLSTGMYIVRITVNNAVHVQKIALMK